VAVPQYCGTIPVPAGETVRAESFVLGSADLPEGTCLPQGAHRVRTSGRAAPSADGVLGESDETTDFEWGSTLRVG